MSGCRMAAASTSAASSPPRTRRSGASCLTAYDDDEAILAAVLAGAAGYIRKDVAGDIVVDGIRTVAAGRSLLDPGLVARVTRNLHDAQAGDRRLAGVSSRERDVLTSSPTACRTARSRSACRSRRRP